MKHVKLIFLLFLFWSAPAQSFFVEIPVLGESAPDRVMQTTQAGETTFSAYRKDQKAIIFVWATWCPTCPAELKMLNDNAQQFEKQNIKLLIVNLGDSAKDVESYVKRKKIQLNVFMDKESWMVEEYGVFGVPSYYFVNEQGIVLDMFNFLPDDYEEIFKEG